MKTVIPRLMAPIALFVVPMSAQAADMTIAPASHSLTAETVSVATFGPLPLMAQQAFDDDDWYDDDDRWDRRDRRRFREGRRFRRDQRIRRNTRIWRGRDGRFRCRRDDGTTGLLIGGVVGGLIGNELGRRGDKTLTTLLGAVGGAFLGREIDRDGYRCR